MYLLSIIILYINYLFFSKNNNIFALKQIENVKDKNYQIIMQELLKIIWGWLKKQSPEVLQTIIMILVVWILGNYTISGIKDVFKDQQTMEQRTKQKREQYVVAITPIVNRHINDIISKDVNATNVILLNYHNTLLSSHGLSYRYLTAICEQFKGLQSKPCAEYWKELDYMNYGDEITKINMASCLQLPDLSKARETLPKFTYLLERSGFKSATFYPILGVDGPVGLLIVGYTNKYTDVTIEYIKEVINYNIQPLSTLLDYDYVLKNDN